MTLDVQFLTMAAMMASGAALGLLYDTYRVLSGEFRFPRWTTPPLDVLYWVIGTAAIYRVLYISNGGEVRLYVFLALMIGVSFYFGLLSGLLSKLMRWLIRKMVQFIQGLIRLGTILLIRPVVALYKLFIIILGFLGVVSIFLAKLMLQLLYPLWKITLWLMRPLGMRLYRLIGGDNWLRPAVRGIVGFAQKLRYWRNRK